MKCWELNSEICIWQVLGFKYNSYLIKAGGRNLLVDTARSSFYDVLKRHLNHKLKQESLNYLVLTHTHYDHCENAAQLINEYNCKLVASKFESGFLQEGSTPLPRGVNLLADLLTRLGNKYATDNYRYSKVVPDIEVDKSYEFTDLTGGIKILTTPGHSVGSISVIIENEIAIVGDNLFGVVAGKVLPHFADDKRTLIKSWKKLLDETNCHTFLPGHGKEISRGVLEKEYLRFSKKY